MAREVITITTRGIKDIERLLNEMPERTLEAARLSVNDTTQWARTQASREMRRQVNFPARYLDSTSDGRLFVSKRARGTDLEARITGRRHPTSLARFLTRKPSFVMGAGGRKGKPREKLQVRVKPGRDKTLQHAFAMKLKAGNADLDTQFNVGIALRVPKGTALTNTRGAKLLRPKPRKDGKDREVNSDLYLLYAPSVDQVFQDVAKQFQEPAARKLEQEFLRQFTRLGG